MLSPLVSLSRQVSGQAVCTSLVVPQCSALAVSTANQHSLSISTHSLCASLSPRTGLLSVWVGDVHHQSQHTADTYSTFSLSACGQPCLYGAGGIPQAQVALSQQGLSDARVPEPGTKPPSCSCRWPLYIESEHGHVVNK